MDMHVPGMGLDENGEQIIEKLELPPDVKAKAHQDLDKMRKLDAQENAKRMKTVIGEKVEKKNRNGGNEKKDTKKKSEKKQNKTTSKSKKSRRSEL